MGRRSQRDWLPQAAPLATCLAEELRVVRRRLLGALAPRWGRPPGGGARVMTTPDEAPIDCAASTETLVRPITRPVTPASAVNLDVHDHWMPRV